MNEFIIIGGTLGCIIILFLWVMVKAYKESKELKK